jgi:hypothetical protein
MNILSDLFEPLNNAIMKDIKQLSQILSGEDHLTIVIGSGVNRYASGNKNTILTSWTNLLDAAFEKKSNVSSKNYILDFERRLVDKTSNQDENAANDIQNAILKGICESMRKEQVKSIYSKNYPTYLLNKEIVSNVVSLNFDLIPELIISGGKIPRLGKRDESISRYKESNMGRYREIDGIRYWHPHGDIANKESLVLGMRQYIKHLDQLEVMRQHHKGLEKMADTSSSNTWYEALVNHPVLVLGASLSDNELDIWGALINRERNFAKGKNRSEYRPPVYIMWSECESGKFNKPDWVTPIFSVKQCYDKQWQKLKNLFEEHGKH